jgi:glycosyltransferase involved in cell wall biosynthesis
MAAMDAALVVASPAQEFHYSPLKLGEYLAAGLPVVAPAVEQIERRCTDGVDIVLVPPGDTAALRAALIELRDDELLRARVAKAARATAEREWSWDHQIRRILDALGRSARERSVERC